MTLKGRTIVITGASRGIGREMALRFARDGANLVIAAKSNVPHPKLPGTIFTVADEVEKAGGRALPIRVDVKDENEVLAMAVAAAKEFGGIDALVNNAGAIQLSPVAETAVKRYDMMQDTNARAVFLCTQACLPYLVKSPNPHILNLSPPLNPHPRWIANQVAYTISKFGMSLATIGMAEEFRKLGIAVNSLWPRIIIATAAVKFLMGEEGMKASRSPEIMADAAYAILTTPSRELTGQLLLDEDFLRSRGVEDFSRFANSAGKLTTDFYID